MANFDPGTWYHLYVNENKDNAFIGTSLYVNNGTAGEVFYQPTNLTEGRQRRQFYAVNQTFYVLRSREGGPDAFLEAAFSEAEDTPGQTRAHMIRGNVPDDSIFWRVTPWGDGSFFLTNKANGTSWHLGRKASDELAAMDSNITKPQNGQRWSFDEIQAIKNDKYSTVDLPNATVSTPSTITPTGSGYPTDTSNPGSSSSSSSSGLSTGAKGAIGASIGGVALIALVVLGLFLRRRKQRQGLIHEKMSEGPPNTAEWGDSAAAHEVPHDSAVKQEMPETQYAELPQNERAVELPSSPVAR